MNADKNLVFNPRLSVFIGGHLFLHMFLRRGLHAAVPAERTQ
jgi:hypothetical protein